MSKAKRRVQANNRGAFVLGLEPDEFAQWVIWQWKPHHIIRFAERKGKA